jgi:DNA-directed RNA polymerase subunit M/transcription elongation factor TFIIS
MSADRKYARKRECMSCGHVWHSPCVFAPYTPNLSGERTEQCPECNSRGICSYPAYEIETGLPPEFFDQCAALSVKEI